jgi:L-ascorbate metabolism protein UlaG (beta-lactamase superfamily)
MKLTKFAQSCVLLEDNNTKILIDPGFILVDQKTINAWKEADYILITHKHADHFDEATVQKLISKKTKIYSTKETAEYYPNTKFEIIKEKDTFKLGNTKVEVVKAIHGYTPMLKGGKEVNEAIGYILDNGKKKIYHTGDTISFQNDYKCNILLLPFNNHGVCMGPFEAALFAKETNAELIIPIHYDNSKLPGDVNKFEEELKKNGLNFKFLKIGESIEI